MKFTMLFQIEGFNRAGSQCEQYLLTFKELKL